MRLTKRFVTHRASSTAGSSRGIVNTNSTPAPVSETTSPTLKQYFKPLKTKMHGADILHDPLWNKSMAFTESERDRLGLRGLIPPKMRSIESQVQRLMGHLRLLPGDVEKNLFLQEVHNRNETVFHRILVEYIEEIAPLVYTPTVGTVCQQFGHRFTRSRGMYFSTEDQGNFSTMVYNWPHDDVHVIVVTDGSRILGLGDLGVHGMCIPIGKLALYVAAGGIAPHRVLPITLDVGTNNQELLNDPDYVGLSHRRLEGDDYFEFLDEFMHAVYSRWPNVVVQFEDFESSKAEPILTRYRHKYRVFNDDIQGTGCVTLAGIMSAANCAGAKSLADLRYMCVGAGSAGLGVSHQLLEGMMKCSVNPLSRDEARSKIVICDVNGAVGIDDHLHHDLHYPINDTLNPWINRQISDGSSLLETIHQFKPNVLLGLSAQPNIFTEDMIRAMAQYCKADGKRPVILPMSNPTSRCECTAHQAYEWTNGEAVVATGSPFKSVTLSDGRVFTPSQCNNMYIFPGLGLAASVGGISSITDQMLYVAAVACSESLTEEEKLMGRTFPAIKRIRDVSFQVAVAVIKEGMKEGLANKIGKKEIDEGIENLVARKMYYPVYVPLL